MHIEPSIEFIFIKVQFHNGHLINFITAYRPPIRQKNKLLMDEKKFMKLFQSQISNIDLNINTFVLGDFNFNILFKVVITS